MLPSRDSGCKITDFHRNDQIFGLFCAFPTHLHAIIGAKDVAESAYA